jgi:hypothetical protein
MIRETSFRSFVIKIINRDERLQGRSGRHPLALPNRRIHSQARLRSLPMRLSSVVVVVVVVLARVQMCSELQAQQAPLVLALEASDKPSPHNPQQPGQECLGQPSVSLNSRNNNHNNHNNHSNNLQASGVSVSHSSSQRLGLASLGSRISPPLASGLVVPSGQQV